jgi:dienelactone hydrolase
MHTEYIDYHLGPITMQGFVAYQNTHTMKPLVAQQGFVGFALDLYGKNQRGSDTDKALNKQLMGKLMQERESIVPKIQAAIDCAHNIPVVDKNKTMLVGFCLGGLCALDFARSGVKLNGIVSVHGALTPATGYKNKINTKILVLHGHLDKSATPEVLSKFHNEMTEHQADWQTLIFGQAMHAFTNPHANDLTAGLKYDPLADQRTWRAIKNFSDEIFG